eukprot:2746791-Amphidinium_carterae.1
MCHSKTHHVSSQFPFLSLGEWRGGLDPVANGCRLKLNTSVLLTGLAYTAALVQGAQEVQVIAHDL